MVQAKIFTPNPKPVMEVVGESELVIVPLPDINVHTPVPTVAVFAAIIVFGLVIQSVWDKPALATVGTSLTVIVTFETEGAHGAFEIVHAKTLLPKPSPVIEVVGEREFVIVPLPEINVQAPIPTNAVLADMVVVGEEAQSV